MADRAAIRFTLALPGLSALTVGLSRLKTDIADWTTFWTERFGPFFYYMRRQDFVLEGAQSGSRWAPLSPEYAKWKVSRFPGKGILVRSGALKSSLMGPTDPMSIFRPGPTSLEIGTSVPYAIYHQMGGTWPSGRRSSTLIGNLKRSFGGTTTLPQRPPMRVDDAFMRVVGKDMQKHVQAIWAQRRVAFIADVKTGIAERVA